MFEFLMDVGNYDDRKIDRYDSDELMVSTAKVSDGAKPMETAICHPFYNSDKHIIVENYSSEEEAKVGHKKWLKIMTDDDLPEFLDDCANAKCAQLIDALGGSMRFYIDNTES